MGSVKDFIATYDGDQRTVLSFLDSLVISFPGVTSKISYGIPFYHRKSWICYLNPTKDGKIEFAFPRGNELSNEQGILDSKGRKQVMSVTFGSYDEIPQELLNEIIQEALLLDEEVPYAPKRKKKS